MRVATSLLPMTVISLLAACGGGGGDSGGTNPPPPANVSSVALSKTTATIKPTESTSITATPKDANGNALSGRTVNWTVSPAGVASITPNGSSVTVTGTANGQTQVTATVEGIAAHANITVTNTFGQSADVTVGPGGQFVFDPSQVDIGAGGTVTFSWAGGVTHNVTWQSPPASVPNIPDKSSGSQQVTFATAGTYNYQCTIHAGMTGAVTVH
jgi:plastocyanin